MIQRLLTLMLWMCCLSFAQDGKNELGLLLGAANRDPEQFPDPDRLDIGRTPNRHDAFSFGIHFCVGAPLGRAEAAIAIGTVLRRLPNLKLESTTPHWRPTMNNRGLQTLRVTF